MNVITFLVPPFPTFIKSGIGKFTVGKKHFKRTFPIFDLLYVTSGTLFMMENGIPYEVKSGQYLLLTPGLEHSGHKNSQEETMFYWLHFTIEHAYEVGTKQEIHWGEIYLKEGDFVQPAQFQFHIPKFGQIRHEDFVKRLFENIISIQDSRIPEYLLKQQIYFQELLIQLQKEAMSIPSATERICEDAISFIQKNYHEEIKMEDIARELHFHSDYITRCMQKVVGLSPTRYLNQYRITQAKRLLASTNDKIMVVSRNVGISDHTYFSKLFKKIEGISPSEYRQFVHRGKS